MTDNIINQTPIGKEKVNIFLYNITHRIQIELKSACKCNYYLWNSAPADLWHYIHFFFYHYEY